MAHSRTAKIRGAIKRLKKRARWKIRTGAAVFAIIMILGAAWWLFLPLPRNYETEIPLRPSSYSVTLVSSECGDDDCRIQLRFHPAEPALIPVPDFDLKEIPNLAKTSVIFESVSKINRQFDYGEIMDNPLIDSIVCEIKDNRLVIEINRKGAYLPARISAKNSLAVITMAPARENYPVIFNQAPANNSAAFPANRAISFDATLKSPLKSATAFFQGEAVELTALPAGGNAYRFSFNKTLEIDKEYSIKAIVSDSMNRTMVSAWTFTAQIPSAAALGKDRFKYLGWWGEINANGVAVRKGIAASSDKLGTLSSANRVKVIKEVYGEWVDGKNLWYKIDGGMYAGAYVFSDYVTPMTQPQAPEKFLIPEGVAAGEKWIDVDLTKKILTLFDYDEPIFATYISPGRAENPTRTGTYRVWYKLKKAEMRGGPPLHTYRYHLKNVPWTMYYNYDYAIHGTYWHDKFGMPQSAGCTNMTQGDAKFIFENTLPAIPEDKQSIFSRNADGKGAGTVVHNHE